MALKDTIYMVIRNDIVFGRLMPGERVTEASFAERFQCSRAPIREALNKLAQNDFVELKPNQGAVVTKISPEEVKSFYALLRLLEGKAVEWATPKLTSSDVERLLRINASLKKVARKRKTSLEEWINLNGCFHKYFRERCGNNRMDWLVEEIRIRISRYRYTSLMVAVFDTYIRDHGLIIDAVREGNARKARDAMENHIERAKEELMNFFSHMPDF
jgi:DNA-binding GntR family transcriptional regulator